jgi:hypothetical protein
MISPQCHITSSVRRLSAVLYVLRGYRAAHLGFCDFCGRSVVFFMVPCRQVYRSLSHTVSFTVGGDPGVCFAWVPLRHRCIRCRTPWFRDGTWVEDLVVEIPRS